MTKRLVTSVIGLSILTLAACGTLTGAGVGAARRPTAERSRADAFASVGRS